MPSVWLTPEVVAARTPDGLAHPPRYSVGGLRVSVSGFRSARDHDAAYVHTHGSHEWLWSGDDEMRFRTGSGVLDTVYFQVPQVPADPADAAFLRWLEVPPTPGGLRLPPGRNFALPPTSSRWVGAAGTWLICGNERNRAPGARPERLERLRLTEGFDLLIADGALCGWLLEGPERFLVDAWEPPPTTGPEPEVAVLLSDYLTVVARPWLARMAEGDPDVRERLAALEERAAALGSGVLRRAVRRHLNNWYP